MPNDVIWMRLGDAEDYHAYACLDEAADDLAQFGVTEVQRCCLYGVSASGFKGMNYISLYWGPDPGDGSGDPSRKLTDKEIESLNFLLEARKCSES